MLRRVLIFTILVTATFFAVGWYPVKQGWIEQRTYLDLSGVGGGLASVIGLLSLVRSPLTRRDFESVEWESVEKIARTEQQIHQLEDQKAKAHSELETLTRTRQQLADLVKKAGAVMFLQEELDQSAQKLMQHLHDHPAFRKELEEYRTNAQRLIALNEEIEQHADVELITEIVGRARRRRVVRRVELYRILGQVPIFGPYLKLVFLIVDAFVRAIFIIAGRHF